MLLTALREEELVDKFEPCRRSAPVGAAQPATKLLCGKLGNLFERVDADELPTRDLDNGPTGMAQGGASHGVCFHL